MNPLNIRQCKMNQKDLFSIEDNVVELVPEEEKVRTEFDTDEILVRWTQEASSESPPGHQMRVARFKNGKRGIQFIRGDNKNPHFVAQLTLSYDEYFSLAQCIFRDSRLIRELCEKFPSGVDATIDKLREFCKVTNVVSIG